VAKEDDRNSPGPKIIHEWALAADDHGWCMALGLDRHREVPNMDLGSANGIRTGDQVNDVHAVALLRCGGPQV